MTTEQKEQAEEGLDHLQSLAKQEYDRHTIEMIAIRAKRDWNLDKISIQTSLRVLKIPMDFDRLLHSESYTFTHDIGHCAQKSGSACQPSLERLREWPLCLIARDGAS